MRWLVDLRRGAAFRARDVRIIRSVPALPDSDVPRVQLILDPDGEHHGLVGPDITEWEDVTAQEVADEAVYEIAMRLDPFARDAAELIIDEDWWGERAWSVRDRKRREEGD